MNFALTVIAGVLVLIIFAALVWLWNKGKTYLVTLSSLEALESKQQAIIEEMRSQLAKLSADLAAFSDQQAKDRRLLEQTTALIGGEHNKVVALEKSQAEVSSRVADHQQRQGLKPQQTVTVRSGPDTAPMKEVWRPGDRVRHRLWGEGTVLKVTESGGATMVEVLFKDRGKKVLDATFANFERV